MHASVKLRIDFSHTDFVALITLNVSEPCHVKSFAYAQVLKQDRHFIPSTLLCCLFIQFL